MLFLKKYWSLLSCKTFLIDKLLSLITKLPSAPLNRQIVCLSVSPCAVAMVCSTPALFILWNRCFPQSLRRWQLLLTLSLSLSTFLLSDIFTGEYFLLIFSCLHLYLFSSSSFDLGCACILFFFWVQLTLIWSRFLMLYLLGEGERQVLVNFG